MQQAGWTNVETSLTQIRPVKPSHLIDCTEWKAIFQRLKQKTMEERQASRHTWTDITENYHFFPNTVNIVDRAYLEKKNYTTGHETAIEEIRQQFQLNHEQERAFHIIAHHSIMPQSEQLMMYTGGMAGTGKS